MLTEVVQTGSEAVALEPGEAKTQIQAKHKISAQKLSDIQACVPISASDVTPTSRLLNV